MACLTSHFLKFSVGSLLPNSPTPLVPGGGFASTDDKQCLNAFIWLSIRHSYCSPDINLADIIDTAHDNLFQQVRSDPNHVLAHLLPNRTSTQYNLRPRQHDRQLIPKMSKFCDNCFTIRVLYWLCIVFVWCILTLLHQLLLYHTFIVCFLSFYVQDVFCHCVFKQIWMNEWMSIESNFSQKSTDLYSRIYRVILK